MPPTEADAVFPPSGAHREVGILPTDPLPQPPPLVLRRAVELSESTHSDAMIACPAEARAAVLVTFGGAWARRRAVRLADLLHHHRLATLVADGLGPRPLGRTRTGARRVARSVRQALDWLEADPRTRGLPLLAVADAHTAAGLVLACAEDPGRIRAAACLGGRLDRVGEALRWVRAPVLLFAAGRDAHALATARAAQLRLTYSELTVVERSASITREPGAFHAAASHLRDWLGDRLGPTPQP